MNPTPKGSHLDVEVRPLRGRNDFDERTGGDVRALRCRFAPSLTPGYCLTPLRGLLHVRVRVRRLQVAALAELHLVVDALNHLHVLLKRGQRARGEALYFGV